MSDAEKIAEAAANFVAIRDRFKDLNDKRASFVCKNHTPDPDYKFPRPCWKRYHNPGYPYKQTTSGWCEPCKQRQKVYLEMRWLGQQRGVALRTLIRYVRAAEEGGDGKRS